MSKTGFQTQGPVGWEAEYVARSGCQFWMGIDNFPALPCKVIGRVYWDQTDTDRVVSMGAAGADQVFARAEPVVKANPHVHAWVLLNEASIWNPGVRAGFGAFNRRLTERLAAVGARHVCGNVNVGHPASDYWTAGVQAIGEACQGAAYLGLHGYSWPGLLDGWKYYVGRFEDIYAALRAAGFSPPPCLMTELGLDRAVAGQSHAGWRQVPLTPQGLADQIAAFEQRVAGNPDLAGALWFLAGAGAPWDAYGFDVDRATAMLVADRIKDGVTPPPSNERAKGFYASSYQGAIDWRGAWDEGYRYVFVRASSGLSPDPAFVRNMEAAIAGGFLIGVFHWLHPTQTGQAKFFREAVGNYWKYCDLGAWGDFENVAGLPPLTRAKAEQFFVAADGLFGRKTGFYTSPGWMNANGGDWTDRPLWLAHWTDAVNPSWPRWTFWQKECVDPFGPFPKRVCLDFYNGTDLDLYDVYASEEEKEEEPVTTGIKFCDRNGNDIGEAAFRAIHGDFRAISPPGSMYHLTELWDSGDNVGMDFQVHVRPAYPAGARLVILNGGKAYGSVKTADMQEGAVWQCYAPPDVGAYTVTVEAPEPADSLIGAGWLCETGHRHIQKYVFQYGAEPVATYHLTLGVQGQGTVTVSAPGPYPAGAAVQVAASPAAGWQFAGWSGDASGAANPLSVLMDRDKSITANFTQIPVQNYTLTIGIVGQGLVDNTPYLPSYPVGTTVSLRAIPSAGWAFAGWSGAVTGLANPATLTMDANKVVTATFVEDDDPVARKLDEARALLAQADRKIVEARNLYAGE